LAPIPGNDQTGCDLRIEAGPERPELHDVHERRAAAGVHEAQRRPACPRDEDRLAPIVVARRRFSRSQLESFPAVGPQVQVELQRRAVLAVVVAVGELRPRQVFRPGDGGQRVAVPLAGREAPQRLKTGLQPPLAVGGDPAVIAGVGVGFVGDVDDAGGLVRIAAEVGFHAAVDAQEICVHA